ncbi:MAG: hypothetical protein FJZ92_00850 [Chloroflexi bacterium]|nr:hypothetical protein [Chloroflexota bacterium]
MLLAGMELHLRWRIATVPDYEHEALLDASLDPEALVREVEAFFQDGGGHEAGGSGKASKHRPR